MLFLCVFLQKLLVLIYKQETLSIQCVKGKQIAEVTRGVRAHFEKFIKELKVFFCLYQVTNICQGRGPYQSSARSWAQLQQKQGQIQHQPC